MLLIKRLFGERMERRAKRLNGGAKVKVREGDVGCFSQVAVVEKLILVEGELRKMKENQHSLTVDFELTQREL